MGETVVKVTNLVKRYKERIALDNFSLEIRNAARRYFETCKTDGYHRKFFGIAASKPEEKEKQRCIDVWRMTYGLAERLGLEEEMDLFCRALSEAYRLSRVDGLTLTEAYRSYK